MPKILVLNQATLDASYASVMKAAYDTWNTYNHPDVKIIHYYGKYNNVLEPTDKFEYLPNDGECLEIGNDLICGSYDNHFPQNHPTLKAIHDSDSLYTAGNSSYKINDSRGEKFIMALEYCLNNYEFDFIQRISCTSYVDIPKMHSYLSTMSKTKVYNGARNMYNSEYYFIAGHCVLMSRDIVEVLVKNKEKYLSLSYPEDVATGKIILYDSEYTNIDEQMHLHSFTFVDPDNITLCSVPSVYCYKTRNIHPEVFYKLHELLNIQNETK
jgi:hypothetical protein